MQCEINGASHHYALRSSGLVMTVRKSSVYLRLWVQFPDLGLGKIHDRHVLSIFSSCISGVPCQETRGRYNEWMIIKLRVWFLKFRLMGSWFWEIY